MIDHVSIAVRDLEASGRFYEAVLGTLGYARLRAQASTLGFGKRYPEFWLNHRPAMAPAPADSGYHVCLRAPDAKAVEAFHVAALRAGGSCDGAPGWRPEYSSSYYACFVRDPEGNRIEAATFIEDPK
jgi:catechol 2,3-dioxygenase-like lactoylglutathione lyase family enzyme